jgi:HK97 family phage major capsid protein
MNEKLKAKEDALAGVRAKISKVFEQAGDSVDFSKVTEISGTDVEKCAALQVMSKDAEKLAKEVSDLAAVFALKDRNQKEQEEALERNRQGKTGAASETKGDKPKMSLGEAYIKAGAYKGDLRGKDVNLDGFEVKTLMDRGTTSGVVPQSLRSGRLVDYPMRPIQVLDLIPAIPTGQAAYKYMDETTRDESAIVEKAEAGAFGELALAQTERTQTIEKIPAWIPVTDEQLADVEGIAAYIDNRLTEALRRRLDYQALNGTGVTPLMLGVLNKAGVLAQAASAGDGNADVVLRAVTAVRVTGRAIASGIVLHPTDWLNERLRKTKDGAYIWGNPDQVGIQSMWGLPVAQADSIVQGQALVGDFRMYSAFVSRQEIQVKSGYINDDLIKGRNAIVASMRGAFVWFRASAFSTVALPAVIG